MRKSPIVLLSISLALLTAPALAHELSGVKLRTTPATRVPSLTQMHPEARERLSKKPLLAPAPALPNDLRMMNCGNDGVPTAENTLILNPLDAAGTIYAPQTNADSLDIQSVSFAVFDGGADYPGTIAVDFWQAAGADQLEFVAGVDVIIPTNPGIAGDTYDIDLSSLNIRTNNELMVLLSDPNAAPGKAIYPAGDSTPSCYDGTDFCSVLLDGSGGGLFLYGTTDPLACLSPANSYIILFDVVVQVQVDAVMLPVEGPSFGVLKSRFGR